MGNSQTYRKGKSIRYLYYCNYFSSAKVEEEVEDKGRLDTSRSVRTEFADDFEPELQNLETCRSENQVDVVQQPDINIKVFMNGNTTPQVNGNVKSAPNESTPLPHAKQPSSMLQINIPQADVVDTTSDKGSVGQRMKSPLMKGRRTPLSSRSASRPRYAYVCVFFYAPTIFNMEQNP